MTRTVILTGASGFVGEAVLSALLASGAAVVALCRRRPRVVGRYDWLQCDLLDPNSTASALNGINADTLIHAAWNVEHGKFWNSVENLEYVEASLRLFRTVAHQGVSRIVGVGTCYEYDWPTNTDCDEFTTEIHPATLYGISKDATRRILESFCTTEQISFAWGRIFFLYGPNEVATRLVPTVVRALLHQQPALVSRGTVIRDFMHVGDAGTALARLALSSVKGPVNIASGNALPLSEIVSMVARLMGRIDLVRLGAIPDRPDDPPRIVGRIERLCHEVGFEPVFTLEQGLLDAIAFWQKTVGSRSVKRESRNED